MNQCKQCGATLPENSKTCLQCGAENTGDPGNLQPEKELDFLKPALIAGSALGVFATVMAALPAPLSTINTCCCLWLCGSGAYAVVLLNKQRPGTLKYGDGALVGAFTGVFGALVSTILGIPLRLLMTAQLEQAAEQIRQAQMPPAMRDFFLQLMAPGINITVILIGLVMGLVLNAIFAAVGGSLTVAIMNRKKND